MDVPRLVDDAPSAVDPKHGQIVAVPLARELATDPDQCRVTLKRQAVDPPLVGSRRVACRLLALGDKVLQGLPLQLSLVVADDAGDRKSTRLNSSHANISYAVFCLKKKNK